MEQFKIVDKNDVILAQGIVFESHTVIMEWTSAIKTLSFYDNIEQIKEFVCGGEKGAKFISLKKANRERLREYYLQRNEDFSGVSGTGVVAKGIILPSGKCAHEWSNSYVQSINIYPNIKAVEHVHGHEGRTLVKYIE